MKIKYNFGILKQFDIGFLTEDKKQGFHDILLDVKQIKEKYRFIFKNNYIEVDENVFPKLKIEKINNIYWFIQTSKPILSGFFVFSLFDTYGFPMEITKEIMDEKGIETDVNGFEFIKEMQKEKNKGTFKNKNAF